MLICEEWQKIIKEAELQKQMWFLAAVFGGKSPMTVNAKEIEIKYKGNEDNKEIFIISSKGKSVELPLDMIEVLIDRVKGKSDTSQNIYSASTLRSNPPKAANQYGVAPKKKEEATQSYGPVDPEPQRYGPVPRAQDGAKQVMGNAKEALENHKKDEKQRKLLSNAGQTYARPSDAMNVALTTTSTSKSSQSPPADAPSFNPATTTRTTRAPAVVPAATQYASMPKGGAGDKKPPVKHEPVKEPDKKDLKP